MRRTVFLLLMALLPALALAGAASAAEREGTRKALVIGIGDYRHVGRLENPPNDVTDISSYLLDMKFQVTRRMDLSSRDSQREIDRFLASLSPGDTALFYYSGHAVQIGRENYMLPSDARISSAADLQRVGINVNRIIARLEQRPGVNLVFLDACRNNPFLQQAAAEPSARGVNARKSNQSVAPGLASMQSTSGNTLIVYAAAAGKLALDGTGQRNSPFTHSLLKHISAPGLEVEVMLKRVTGEVRRLTRDNQSPERLSRLTDEFYFNPLKINRLASRVNTPLAPRPKARRKAGDTFRDCQSCPEMVVLPSSRPMKTASRIGSAGASSIAGGNRFAASRSEISFDAWQACANAGGCAHRRPKDNGWGRGERPAINVSWRDALAYTKWLSRTTGRPYRLLTEPEWQFAANGGKRTSQPDPKLINFDASTSFVRGRPGLYRGQTVLARELPANRYGLYNMLGNVAEWVDGCWDSRQPAGTDCQARVARGASWYDSQDMVSAATRNRFDANTRVNIIGFRVALSLDE